MRKVIFLAVFMLSLTIFAQSNWTDIIESNINVSAAIPDGVDIFTNGSGIHIIVNENNALKYYKMDAEGNAGNPYIIENTSVTYPSISGDSDNLYIVYGIGISVRTKRSTDGGSSWSTLSNHIYLSEIIVTESVVSNGNLHVTYQRDNKIWYRYYKPLIGWSSELEVSLNEQGIIPRIAAWHSGNEDKVYFFYKRQNSLELKWREYNVATNSWSHNPQLAIYIFDSWPAGIAVTQNMISFYYMYFASPNWYFKWVIKDKSNHQIISTCYEDHLEINYASHRLYSSRTYNNNVHVPLWYNFAWEPEEGEEPALYRSNGVNCDLELIYFDNMMVEQNIKHINGSAFSNDFFVIWQDEYIGPNLRMIYDDQPPLAPKNLTITQGVNNHPILSWSANTEPDRSKYYIYRNPGSGWVYLGQTTSTSYEDETLEYCTQPPPKGCNDENTYFYHVKAVDIGSNISEASNEVRAILVGGGPPQKAGSDNAVEVSDYRLGQNFPNPFNPTTIISYSIHQDALVTLKVYDILGTEVAELVNQVKPSGYYEVNFNSSSVSGGLSSGVYIYRLTAANNDRILFTDTKRMLLMK